MRRHERARFLPSPSTISFHYGAPQPACLLYTYASRLRPARWARRPKFFADGYAEIYSSRHIDAREGRHDGDGLYRHRSIKMPAL